MYLLGHVGISLLLFAPLAAWLLAAGETDLAVSTGTVMVAVASLPDLDEYTDRLAHRGPTHTLWFALGVGLAVGLAVWWLGVGVGPGGDPLDVGLVLGGASTLALCGHLAGDLITPMGIRPFRPLSVSHHTLDLTAAKNPRANRLFVLAGVGALASAVGYVTVV